MDARKLEGNLLSSGRATGSHSSGAKFSAPKGAQKFAGDFSSPGGAQKSKRKVRVAGGQHGKRGETSRFASGEVPQVEGAATPSDKAVSRGIATRLDSLGDSNASVSNVANGRLANEPLSQMDCAALPSGNVIARQGDDCSVTDRTAELQEDSSDISVHCGTARGTAECRPTAGNTPGVVEKCSDTAVGVERNWENCAGFPLCESMISEHLVGAATPSPVVDSYHCHDGAAPPTTVEFSNSPAPGLFLRNDRLINDRSRFDRRADSVLADANDTNVKFDDFGYLCDMSDDNCTDISANSCDSVAFNSFSPKRDVLDDNAHTDENAPECGIEYCSAELPRDRINLGTAISDVGFSQRPRRELRRPAKYADFSVDFANSQYNRRIRKCELGECSLSHVQASSDVLTSRGLQPRLPIGPLTCLGHLHRQNNNISERFDESGQLSELFCGDNLGVAILPDGQLVSCDSDSYIVPCGDRINTLYDDSTVVSAVALDTLSDLYSTNHSVAEYELLMARTKQTDKKDSEQRQPGVSQAVKEWTCFACGWTTEWSGNLKRHLARIHSLREDGTLASPSYRETFANKRSTKWQEERAATKSKDCEHNNDVESCAPPMHKKPKVSVRKVGRQDKKGLMGVESTHTIPLSGKINLEDKDANFSASDILKAKGARGGQLQ